MMSAVRERTSDGNTDSQDVRVSRRVWVVSPVSVDRRSDNS